MQHANAAKFEQIHRGRSRNDASNTCFLLTVFVGDRMDAIVKADSKIWLTFILGE